MNERSSPSNFWTTRVISSISCSTIYSRRWPAAVGQRQAKGLPPRASRRTVQFEFGSVGYWLGVKKGQTIGARLPHFCGENGSSYLAQSEALPRSAVQSLIALKRGHHHMARSTLKEGTPGYISAPRSVRPRPSITWRRGSAVSGIASRADIKSQVSMSQPLFIDSPLPTWVQLLPTEPPGALHR